MLRLSEIDKLASWEWQINAHVSHHRYLSRSFQISYSVSRSTVIEYLSEQKDTAVAYHYCDFMDRKSTSPSAILRSLLAKLLPKNGDWVEDKDFSNLISRKDRGELPAGLRDLYKWITSTSKHHGPVAVAVDALDECNEDREELLKLLRGLAQIKGVSVFLTTRKEQDIDIVFQGLPSISLSDFKTKAAADMKSYIDGQLQSRSSLSTIPPELKEEIRSSLVDKADGM